MIIISSFLWVALFAVFMHIYPCIFETALRKKKKGRKERKEERKEGRKEYYYVHCLEEEGKIK
jgi:hypothetical protein